MKKHLYFLVVLLFAAGCATVHTQHKSTGQDPKKDIRELRAKADKDLLEYESASRERMLDGVLFMISWFPRYEQDYAMVCMVTDEGKVRTYGNVYDIRDGACEQTDLDPNLKSAFNELLDSIPDGIQTKNRTGTVTLSYRNRAEWKTSVFERNKMPEGLKRIFDEMKLGSIPKRNH
jgi:hypothetical protein